MYHVDNMASVRHTHNIQENLATSFQPIKQKKWKYLKACINK